MFSQKNIMYIYYIFSYITFSITINLNIIINSGQKIYSTSTEICYSIVVMISINTLIYTYIQIIALNCLKVD